MLLTVLFLIAGIVLLYLGGEALVKGASSLALRLGLTPLAVGLTVVAFGTSVPELVVCVQAAMSGYDDVALGNVVGSNIANVGLILGLTALISPVLSQSRLLKIDIPLMLIAELVAMAFLWDRQVDRYEGLMLVVGLLAYTWFNFRQAKLEKQAMVQDYSDMAGEMVPGRWWLDLVFIAGGIGALVAGGNLFVEGAIQLARLFGVSESLIALSVVALGTSLPELAASVVAAWRGKGDLAIGNVVGSNIFNVLSVLGITAIIRPVTAIGVGTIDLGVMFLSSFLVFPFLATNKGITRFEGAVLLLVYLGYIGWIAYADLS
ncbi:calcium/sodium antiporter [Calycomorphotria hydatis]|uniref:Inner membrane protein YrbG n=1 Tax=Calycomorphotria hydatis TaxID=2528027 RepID=A0A517TBK9_9PLAN|nr:calcium/sodium antiporter [Calycomorphotria hydatis]QDT65762.1 Inner membrane protein YrbG [Calycomorphotria hydatis]